MRINVRPENRRCLPSKRIAHSKVIYRGKEELTPRKHEYGFHILTFTLYPEPYSAIGMHHWQNKSLAVIETGVMLHRVSNYSGQAAFCSHIFASLSSNPHCFYPKEGNRIIFSVPSTREKIFLLNTHKCSWKKPQFIYV